MKVQTKAQRAAALLIVAIIIGVGGCAWTPAKRVVDVTIHDDGGKFRFEPAEISVRRGDVVRFSLGSATMPHNVEFVRNSAPDGADLGKTWSGPYLQKPGDTYEVPIDGSFIDGTYGFVCTPHAALGMKGTLVVDGGN